MDSDKIFIYRAPGDDKKMGPPELILSEEVINKKNLTPEEIGIVLENIFLQSPLLKYADGKYEVVFCDCEECLLVESDNKELMLKAVK